MIAMKRLTAAILALMLVLSFVGCGEKENAVCIDNVTYYSTGKEVPVEPDESVIEYVEIPFGSSETGITAFAMLEEGKTLLCLIDHEWVEFTAR